MKLPLPLPKKHGCAWMALIAMLVLVPLGAYLWYDMNTWDYRKALPWTATEVQEWYWEDFFIPDYDYLLRARITHEQFIAYTQHFEMTLHTEDRVYEDDEMWLNWESGHAFKGDWWNPGPSLEETYVWQSGDSWSFAKYEDGYIYVKGLNH